MEKINELGTYNGKETYYNPCALPLAFVYDGETLPRHEYHDPFEYMEEIWTALSGEPANLFTALEAEKTESKNRAEWTLKIPAGNVTLYGNLPTEENCIAMLQAGTANAYGYSQWLSPQLFMIPYKEGDSTVKVTLTSEKTMKLKQDDFNELSQLLIKYQPKLQECKGLKLFIKSDFEIAELKIGTSVGAMNQTTKKI
jgi:hypothetical protein